MADENHMPESSAPKSPTGDLSRAGFLRLAASRGAALVSQRSAAAQAGTAGETMQTRPIPSSGEALPVIGCGTYVGFDVGANGNKLKALADVIRTLREAGGKVFDSSPMYGRAEAVLGDLLADAPDPGHTFIATKVWTRAFGGRPGHCDPGQYAIRWRRPFAAPRQPAAAGLGGRD